MLVPIHCQKSEAPPLAVISLKNRKKLVDPTMISPIKRFFDLKKRSKMEIG